MRERDHWSSGRSLAIKTGAGLLIVGDDAGRPQFMATLPAGVGGDLILRSAYPDPEAVLIVVKRDPQREAE